MNKIQDTREISVKGDYDVIVAGGGVAGVAAALAGAREGAKTLLIEKSIVLGGLGTIGLISYYEPLCDGRGKKMIGGISEELLRLSIEYGPDDLPEEWHNGQPEQPTKRRYATHYSPTLFAMAMDELLIEAGVDILLDTLITCPVMDEGHCRGLIAENKGGREFYAAKVVIDCTGDADVLHRANIPCVVGENFLTYVCHGATIEDANKAVHDRNILRLRKWIQTGSDPQGNGHPKGMELFKGVTGEDVTEFVLTGRKLMFNKLRNYDRFSSEVISLPTMAQFRTTRHLSGAYDLTGEDLFRHFEDSIGAIGDFRKPGECYEIPYRCLYHSDFDNLLAAGRIVSASGDGWEVTRVIPSAALTGQAAGVAAAICSAKSCSVKDVDILVLQQKLESSGVILHC